MKIKTISITRAEGPTPLCGITKTFTSFKDASAWLRSESNTFPKRGYDKHDFTVVFEDGRTYGGRLDCKHHGCPDNDLDVLLHMKQVATYASGRYMGNRTEQDEHRYLVYLDMIGPEMMRSYADLIDNYLDKMEVEA